MLILAKCYLFPIALQIFLSRALESEMSGLPRGIGRGKSVRSLGAAYDRFLNEIPAFLLSQYETSKRPAVLSGIAGSEPLILARFYIILLSRGMQTFFRRVK